MFRLIAVVPALACVALAGCGGSHPVNGAAVFARSCEGCHSLIGNESRHTPGGDLVHYGFDHTVLTQYTVEMPLRRRLSAAELRAVIAYVEHAERPELTVSGRASG